MRKKLFKSAVALPLFFLTLLLLTGCEELEDFIPDKGSETTTYYGPETHVGNGMARTWVKMSDKGEPLAVGVNMSEGALEGLPEEPEIYMLEMPRQMSSTLYQSVALDWNPAGHDPEHIYTVPHFDMHFYIITEEDRNLITEGPHEHTPAFQENYIPENYTTGFPIPYTGFAVPEMGVHWLDVTAPEFNDEAFTKTFVYGSYNNKVIFHEPMITVAYLQGLAADKRVTSDVPQPLKVQKTGYYPTKYTVEYDATPGEYVVALTNLQHKLAQ
jgi:hypothetical protein